MIPVLLGLGIFLGLGCILILLNQTKQQKAWIKFDTQFHSLEKHIEDKLRYLENQNQGLTTALIEKLNEARLLQHQALTEHRTRFEERQLESLKILQDTLYKGIQDTRLSVKEALTDYAKELGQRVDSLTQVTDQRLKDINQQVEKRLSEGFEKTTETFSDVIKRLALIDAAQKQISELSNNVISLNDILNDRRSRGTFGEVQLAALIRNVIPEQHFSFQTTLSNGKRPDCLLMLPEPTGNIVIDAKFPLETFRQLIDANIPENEKRHLEQQFRIDIRKHIQDIADKYIISGETSDGAVMFIPAEAVFSEIHSRFPELVDHAHRTKVWMVSPTTMMAILTTARAVLKDAATRKQLHIIQKHLNLLSKDFGRFQTRMDNLAKHIAQAHNDVEEVHISAKKITQRFGQIEKVETVSDDATFLPETTDTEANRSCVTNTDLY